MAYDRGDQLEFVVMHLMNNNQQVRTLLSATICCFVLPADTRFNPKSTLQSFFQ